MASCPKPTQDIELNLKNRQKAIDKVGYGPLNPNEPNEKFWQTKADMWDVSISEAKKQKCSNCAAFNRTKEMLDCIGKGMGDEDDSWDAIEAGQLGYCEALDFKCAASRTCDAWIDGNAKSSGAKVSVVDIYLKTVQQLIDTVENKAGKVTEGAFVEWNASGGKARGRVEHVMKKGTLGVPDSKFAINADPDDPAALIRIWKKNSAGEWDETDTLVGHKVSTLSVIDPLSKKAASLYEMEEKATRRVRDAQYWGVPVGTPIVPGMKPTGPSSPAGRARSLSGGAKPSASSRSTGGKVRVSAKKPSGGGKTTSKLKDMSDSDLMGEIDRVDAELDKFDAGPKKGKDKDKYDALSDQLRELMGEADDRGMVNDDGTFNEKAPKDSMRTVRDEESFPRDFVKDKDDRYMPLAAEDFTVKKTARELKKIKKDGREDATGTLEDPIDVGTDVELAHKLLGEGKHIRMASTMELGTLIEKINEIADDAKKRGDKAPAYDFCRVSVPGTNLFCIESKGVPRTKMPQFKGDPADGTFAARRMAEKTAEIQKRIDAGETDKDGNPLKLPREADIEPEFRELLDEMGIKREVTKVPAANLKATQENLDGVKVSGMMRAIKNGDIPKDVLESPIFVTKDGYIVDGHHRWAALVALDLEDGKAGDIDIPVEIIDGDIGYILDIANGFADIGGIKRKGIGAAADGVGGGKKPKTSPKVVLPGVGTVAQSDNTKSAKSGCKPCQGNV